MKFLIRFLPALVLTALFFCNCSNDNSTDPETQPVQGKITATATGITGQNGNVFTVVAYDSDWFPGSESPIIAGFLVTITSDNFSFTQNLHPVAAQTQGGYSSEDMLFEPKTYSVVFFVATPGSPPQYFSEVRVAVNGNVTTTAPSWNNWVNTK